MILGLVLGDLMEKYLYRSVASYGFYLAGAPGRDRAVRCLPPLSLFLTMRGRAKASAKAKGETSACFI